MKIKKGDTVQIMVGKDRGKRGKVVEVFPKINKITIDRLNLYKKHQRPKKQGEKGEMVEIAKPLNISNVMMICGSCGKLVRIGHRFEGDKKIRICKKCQAKI